MFGSYVSIWDADENEKVNICIRMCKDSSIVPIDGPCGMEKCIMVLIEAMNEDCEQWKLLYLVPNVKYYKSTIE